MDFSSSLSLFLALVCHLLLPVAIGATDNPVTKALCGLRTDELIRYYGYESEAHDVTTEDGYILTVFRCNSKNASSKPKKPVIVQHGLLLSSDDFCINPPHQALAYILADEGYDVWLPNSRGNLYSRRHAFIDADNILSTYWNFSFFEMGIYDQPAVFDYVLKETNESKLHYIGYSQGTTSFLIFLSEKPEYNEKIHAASLMAPAIYMNYDGAIYQVASRFAPLLNIIQKTEFLPRNRLLNNFINTICEVDLPLCNSIIDVICGESEGQRNNTMLPAFICHVPSGASLKQFLHYGQEIQHGFFGKYMEGFKIPNDFQLARITTPISLHSSTSDILGTATGTQRLIPKLENSEIFSQVITEPKFNHIDFVWGMNSASMIYSKILQFFDKYQ